MHRNLLTFQLSLIYNELARHFSLFLQQSSDFLLQNFIISSDFIFYSHWLLALFLDLAVEGITDGNEGLRLDLKDCLVKKSVIFFNQKVYFFEKEYKLVDGSVNQDQLLNGSLLIFFFDIIKHIEAAILVLLFCLPCF